MLRQDQLRFYQERGYLGVDGVLTQQEVAELRRATDQLIETSRQVTQHTDQFDLEPDHTPENPRLRRIKTPEAQHAAYRRTQANDRILDIVGQLIGSDIRRLGGKLNMKAPGGGARVDWHQDWAYYPHTNDDILEVGVALDDMTLENGCLMVIPGSHRGPVLDHHKDGIFVGAVAENSINIQEAAPIRVEAGGITVHHVRTLHSSAPNVSIRPRRLLLTGYRAADAWPLAGLIGPAGRVSDWDEWNSLMLRGKPTYEPRLNPVPVRIPLPQPEHSGSIFEIQSTEKALNHADLRPSR